MLGMHLLAIALFSLTEEHGSKDMSKDAGLFETLPALEESTAQLFDGLSLLCGHFRLPADFLEREVLLPVFDDLLRNFYSNSLAGKFKRWCEERELTIASENITQTDREVRRRSGGVPVIHVLQPTASAVGGEEKDTCPQVAEHTQTPNPFLFSIIKENVKKDELPKNSTPTNAPLNRKDLFFERFISSQEHNKRSQIQSQACLAAERQLKRCHSSRNQNFPQPAAAIAGGQLSKKQSRHRRIIKQSMRERPRGRTNTLADLANCTIVDPRRCAFTSFQQLRMTLNDLPDAYPNTNFTQSTLEESLADNKSGSWNCFVPEDSHSIDLEAWNQNIVAVKTPIKEFETLDCEIPTLDLEE